jgi:hypothetical protein
VVRAGNEIYIEREGLVVDNKLIAQRYEYIWTIETWWDGNWCILLFFLILSEN